MDRVWDTSKYHPKHLVSILKVKVTRSRKGQTENFRFGRRDAFLGQFFVKNVENDPKTLYERPKSGNVEIAENSVKMTFLTFKTPKLAHFSRYLLEVLYTYATDRVLSHIFRFL